MSSTNFSSCPSINILPELGPNLPSIPTNISLGYIPARDVFNAPMTTCCSPNPVHLASDCYYWCELPKGKNNGQVWTDCLSNTKRAGNVTENNISGYKLV